MNLCTVCEISWSGEADACPRCGRKVSALDLSMQGKLDARADERTAWDAFALEAMRQILYMAPDALNWGDKMADTPAMFADRVAEVADRILDKRRTRFGGGR